MYFNYAFALRHVYGGRELPFNISIEKYKKKINVSKSKTEIKRKKNSMKIN